MKISIISLTTAVLLFITSGSKAQNSSVNYKWKAGVAKVNITPADPMPMAGFAS
jgi:hypothetical protein